MSLIVAFSLDSPLCRAALSEETGMRLQVEQEAALGPDSTLLTFWAFGTDFAAFEAALERDHTIEDVRYLSDPEDGERLYRVTVPASRTTYWKWVELGAVLLDAVVTHRGWDVRMRFPDRETLSAYRDHCLDRDLGFSLRSVRDSSGSPSDHPYGLTGPQHEILVAALEGGYFEVPRETRMHDLATEFGISDQAASERLRRALSKLLNTIAVDEYYR